MKVKDFNLKQTLECGQCFNYEAVACSESDALNDCFYIYKVNAFGRLLEVRQERDELIFENATPDEISKIWIPYFDLERDYGVIKEEIGKAAPELKRIMEQFYGIHILNQDFVETLISFIISQNSNIPRIKKTVRAISRAYGEPIDGASWSEEDAFAFPAIEKLDQIGEQEYRDLKTGFRAVYLRDAVNRLVRGEINGGELATLDFKTAKARLMTIKGVGDKVANCVLLFGLGFRNAFPVDVWIKRIMEELYFGKKTDQAVIEQFAVEKFGKLGGYAQQYLFIYARNR